MNGSDKEPRTAISNDPDCCCAWWPDEEYGWIINFSNHPIELLGRSWPTVEHYYQCQKFSDSSDIVAKLLAAKAALDAKKISDDPDLRPYVRADWKAIREKVMLDGLWAKVRQHSEIAQALLSTGEKRIVEDSPIDWFWGCGKDGTGRNRLGEMWEEIRSALRKEAVNKSAHSDAEPSK
jgi:ribA/ribD-fused uncharacterized protein